GDRRRRTPHLRAGRGSADGAAVFSVLRLLGSGPDLGAAQRAGAALDFEFLLAARHQPALVGLAVVGVVNAPGPSAAGILLHRENADPDDLTAAQAWVRIFIVRLRLTGLGVDSIFNPSDSAT